MLSAVNLSSASLSTVHTLPTSQEPVNDTVATFGSSQKSLPIPAAFGLLHDTTFSTPLGIPAWWASYKQTQRIITRLRSADPEQYTIIINRKDEHANLINSNQDPILSLFAISRAIHKWRSIFMSRPTIKSF